MILWHLRGDRTKETFLGKTCNHGRTKKTFARKGRLCGLTKSMIGCPALSHKELKPALANLKGRYALRNRALVTLGVRSGLRGSELLALKVSQMWNGRKIVDRFYVQRKATKAKHAGASIVMHPDAAVALTRWVKTGAPYLSPAAFLFRSQQGNGRLNRRSAWKILHRAFRQAGVAGMAGTHCMS